MTNDILALLNRFENAAGVYERSDDPAARDELHAARRAIVERDRELVDLVTEWRRRTKAIGRDVGSYRQCANELELALRTTS